ncbi:MAG: Glutamate synthase [NADPH] small chain [Candidatus Gallionella acididurans]|uniref:Glutamate synthase [NADPH] small chain n=1 Tax=Candidatus Gallionella acididurans TaxID=1796491 RepID=A0A139BQA0_9PROT|nr:MAG: Glutamate synthase [NADPH] small chain [Candidatus Gallionella acididurans]
MPMTNDEKQQAGNSVISGIMQTDKAAHRQGPVMGFGFSFKDLYERDGLIRLDAAFLDFLGQGDALLRAQLETARIPENALHDKEQSALLIALAPHLEDFLAKLFGVEAQVQALAARHHLLAPLYNCKRLFVQRRAMIKVKPEEAAKLDGPALEAQLTAYIGTPFSELAFAEEVAHWMMDESAHAGELQLAVHYAAWATHTEAGRSRHHSGVLFKAPAKLDLEHLVPLTKINLDGITAYRLGGHALRRREGFALTDAGTDLRGALDQANYCIWCHEQAKDSCSKGLREKPHADSGAAAFRKNSFGVKLAGCPLEEKISEFHKVKTHGHALGALAIITVDNPMVAATGHRICNDCMKSCIYQKQQPVDIPQAETRTLKDVLELPWGFEIYSLLTRWNPLHLTRPYPKAPSGRRVLVAGMGPAGFTLAHHLINDGHTVVGIDGLKIEPLPPQLGGVAANGERVEFSPIRDIGELYEALDGRVLAGFGGVAEYGITVRWDKNFLKLIRLLLERRSQFALFGGVRFGGTLTVDTAFASGFDHIALANGAGRPTVLDIPNGLARGVRTASDFLMALQLTGAAKADSIANLQIRLPVVVIGGGLTAIDTATESLAYYPVQVAKFLHRYRILVAGKGEPAVRQAWTPEEQQIADEFLKHALALEAERSSAAAAGREPHIIEMLQSWGGVTIAYRKRLIDSPSYTLNHEEVEKALEEGINFAEGLNPTRIEVDEFGAVCAIRMSTQLRSEDGIWSAGAETEVAARTILIAAGTQPNTVLSREDPEHFKLDGRYFQACDENGDPVHPEPATSKPKVAQVLLSRHADGRFISFFGDLHPSFFGNVVKAMGGAKQGYPSVSAVLERVRPASHLTDGEFLAEINQALRATVHKVIRLTPNIVEVIIRAPLAARNFRPGQFYRLQNYETHALAIDDTRLAMEGLALTGAWVDPQQGLISTIVLEMGGSADLCAMLKPGEPVVLMGPTGTPTEIPGDETVMLVGGGLGNAVLFSIGQALRAAGSKVLYFAGYKKVIDRYKVAEIENAADVVIWCCDEAPGFAATRNQDRSYAGNIVQAMAAYAGGGLGLQTIPFADTDRIIAIGSDSMMAAVAAARHGVLKPHLKPHHFAIGSINSPMQCMMKEICAQCLQAQTDPETGKTTYVFSCFNQDQALDRVDFPGLKARLRQNSVQEKLTSQWIDRCLVRLKLRDDAVA